MTKSGIVRHVDDLHRITLPKEVCRTLNIKEGEPMELFIQKNNTILIKKYKKSWEDTVIEWLRENYNRPAMRRATFSRMGEYTFCVVCMPNGDNVAGFAKRCFGDKEDERIGRVAAFARALGKPINELVGWKD